MTTPMNGFKSRRKVDPELIERYEWDARYNGDKNIKNELSTARRTATTLAKSANQFSHLRPEHKLALDAATSTMRKLAEDLAELVGWAKEYGAFCAAERARASAAELEALAEKRWGNDVKAMEFEAELIRELMSPGGAEAFGEWVQSTGRHLDVRPQDFSGPFDHGGILSSYKQRDTVARLIQAAINNSPHKWQGMGRTHYSCGWKDYEMYLEHRKAAAAAAAIVLSGFAA
ncbi:MAG: hypothetical protein EPN64_04710 [Burkholderiaceae bacterium]|nr:MAG: hypothetical protein EPN64_04710 [Burkholderiaceae bacterium]